MSGNGYFEQRNSIGGPIALNKRELTLRHCFAAAIRLSVKHILGERKSSGNRRVVLSMSSDTSSLVVDMLCDKAREQNIFLACFYIDFWEEQSPTNMLGSLLKQIVGGLENIPDEIRQVFQDHKKAIGGRGLRAPNIIKMLQTITSLQRTFICVDAVDECAEEHRPEFLDSLRQILQKSPNTRIFLTGRRHIRGEIERHLGPKVATLYIRPSNDDIVGYIRMRFGRGEPLAAMDSDLEGEIIKSIAENFPNT